MAIRKKTLKHTVFVLLLFVLLLLIAFWYFMYSSINKASIKEKESLNSFLTIQSDRLIRELDNEIGLLDTYIITTIKEKGSFEPILSVSDIRSLLEGYEIRWPQIIEAIYVVNYSQEDSKVNYNCVIRSSKQKDYRQKLASIYEKSFTGIEPSNINTKPSDDDATEILIRSVRVNINVYGTPQPYVIVTIINPDVLANHALPELIEIFFGKTTVFNTFTAQAKDSKSKVYYSSSTSKPNHVLLEKKLLRQQRSSLELYRYEKRLSILGNSLDIRQKKEEILNQMNSRTQSTSPLASQEHTDNSISSYSSIAQDSYNIHKHEQPILPDFPEPSTNSTDNASYEKKIEEEQNWILEIGSLDTPARAFFKNTKQQWVMLTGIVLIVLYISIVGILLSMRRRRELILQEKNFLASITHELKTPVAVVATAGDNLSKNIVPPDRVAEYGNIIKTEACRLATSIENLLLLGTFEASNINLYNNNNNTNNKVDVCECIEKITNHLKPLANHYSAKIELKLEDNCFVRIPNFLLESVLDSILTNAIKYAGKTIWLTVAKQTVRKQEYVIVTCKDLGPGIPPIERKRILKAFYRGKDTVDKGISGTGLGLYLAQRVTQLFSGKMQMKFPKEGGTVVELFFRSYK